MFLYEDTFGKSRITNGQTDSSTVINVPISALLVGATGVFAKRFVRGNTAWS